MITLFSMVYPLAQHCEDVQNVNNYILKLFAVLAEVCIIYVVFSYGLFNQSTIKPRPCIRMILI